jgi:hypothetical protein
MRILDDAMSLVEYRSNHHGWGDTRVPTNFYTMDLKRLLLDGILKERQYDPSMAK